MIELHVQKIDIPIRGGKPTELIITSILTHEEWKQIEIPWTGEEWKYKITLERI